MTVNSGQSNPLQKDGAFFSLSVALPHTHEIPSTSNTANILTVAMMTILQTYIGYRYEYTAFLRFYTLKINSYNFAQILRWTLI